MHVVDLPDQLVLVLDDYHVIVDPEIHDQLGYLLSRLPLNMHVVVAAQADPPLRLGRLRAMGDLAEVRGEQLRFTDEEAAALFNEVHGLDLDATEIATVQQRIEGWVAVACGSSSTHPAPVAAHFSHAARISPG